MWGHFSGGFGARYFTAEDLLEDLFFYKYCSAAQNYYPKRRVKKTVNRPSAGTGAGAGVDSDPDGVGSKNNSAAMQDDSSDKYFSNTEKQQQQKKRMICFNCGLQWHNKKRCPAEGKTCLKCGEQNHFARVCRSAGEKTLGSDTMKKNAATAGSPASKPKKMKENSPIKATGADKSPARSADTKNLKTSSKTSESQLHPNKSNVKHENKEPNNNDSKMASKEDAAQTKTSTENMPAKSDHESDDKLKYEKHQQLMKEKKDEANTLYKQKKYKLALSQYTRLIELCPSELNYGNRAACYIMMERYEDALVDAKKSVELNSSYIKGYERAIRCLVELGHMIDANIWVVKLESVDQKNERLAIEREKINDVTRFLKKIDDKVSEKKYTEAVKYLDKLIKISSQCVSYKIKKAECLALMEKFKEAETLINDVLKYNKSNPDAVYILGLCLYHLDTDRAVAQLKEVLRLVPDHSDALKLYKKAKALIEKKNEGNNAFVHKRYTKAHHIYTEALGIDPSNRGMIKKLYYNLAQASYKLQKITRCIEECTKALNIDPNYAKALLRRGQCHLDNKDYEEAVADLTKSLGIDSNSECQRLLESAKTLLARAKSDYHGILGVKSNASQADIKKAYRKKALQHHPDKHSNSTAEEKALNERKFKDITRAYRSLTNGSTSRRDDSEDDCSSDCDFERRMFRFMFEEMFRARYRTQFEH
ncbi:dnaJ homolog subfamily C member 7-like [Microplitis mediator]|uniref:dnaJ homolog subfamily C member 7-like n=1 Tax=Microplitis mediator TaxID=375433 RepID=UPI00255641AA|nr:dnaJ homolog subfamily C member 7-like [Microplitis mediator]